jgi:hypothetical protein
MVINSHLTNIDIKHFKRVSHAATPTTSNAWKRELKSSSPDILLLIYSPHSRLSFEKLQDISDSLFPDGKKPDYLTNTTTCIMSIRRELCTNWPMYVDQAEGKDIASQLGLEFRHVIKEKYGFSSYRRPIGFGQFAKDLEVKSPDVFRNVLGELMKDIWVKETTNRENALKKSLMDLDNFEVQKKIDGLQEKTIAESRTRTNPEGRVLMAA